MKPMVGIAALIALAALSLSCSDDDLTGIQTLEQQLESARTRWEARGSADYDYRITYSCFCGFANRPVIVSVQSDEVVSALFVDSGESVPEGLEPHFSTIDGLFDLLASFLANEPDEASIEFDPLSGMPTKASFDFLRTAQDDEIAFQAMLIFTAML